MPSHVANPQFIIIGSMKSGTTTLHEDLGRHPDIFMSPWKEPGFFVGPEFGGPSHLPLRAATAADYVQIFSAAAPGQICGESSTHYTKAPRLRNAARNIYDRLGGGVKLIYVMRDPAKRAISQYMHEFQHGEIGVPTLARAIEEYPHMIDCSRYAMQLQPYRDLFPAKNIMCVKFEHLVTDRQGYTERIAAFVGADPARLPDLDDTTARNTAESRRAWSGWARRLRATPFVQTKIEPYVPGAVLRGLKRVVTKAPPPVVWGGDLPELEERIRAQLSPEDFAAYDRAL